MSQTNLSWAVPPRNAVIINAPEDPHRHNNMLFSNEALSRPQTNHNKKGVKTKIPDHRPKWTIYEKLVYNLEILVPDDPPSQLVVPAGGQLQEVKYGKLQKWRVKMNSWADLPEYLIDHKDNSLYSVFVNKRGSFLPLFDSTSIFLKRWDTLSIILLLYTACVTPFETAFLNTSGKVDTSSILFEIDRVVDVLFFCDMFVQARTPYRDKTTGKLVYEERAIFVKYLKSWALLDLVSIIPFELFSLGSEESSSVNLSELRLLRFLRLARLLKLLRVLRASKKLSKWQVYIQLRYASIQVLKFTFIMLFIIHWLACGFRLASEKNDKVYDAPGWVERYAAKYNTTDVWELYLVSIYWSASRISLSGTSVDVIAPATPREFGYGFFAFFISLLYFVYLMASITDVLSISNRTTRTHDLLVDNYLEMFDTLKLDERLKIKVHEYLTDHFAHSVSTRYTQMLKELPSQLHGFITIEMYIQFLAMIPYLAPFLEREPVMVQDLCRGIEIRSYAPNSHVFTDGYEGIYYLEHGIAAIEGRIYPSTSIFGRTVLRENIKSNECRALTTVTIQLLRKDVLLATLDRYPKVKYYAKRWTAWRLMRKYMLTYARLYYTAAKRGMQMVPQMLTRRPYLMDGEFDDIDLAVIEYISENGQSQNVVTPVEINITQSETQTLKGILRKGNKNIRNDHDDIISNPPELNRHNFEKSQAVSSITNLGQNILEVTRRTISPLRSWNSEFSSTIVPTTDSSSISVNPQNSSAFETPLVDSGFSTERANTAHSTSVGETNDSGTGTAFPSRRTSKGSIFTSHSSNSTKKPRIFQTVIVPVRPISKSTAQPEEENKISHVLSSPKLIIYETKHPDSDKAGGGELTAEDVIHGWGWSKPGYDSIYQHAESELTAEHHGTNFETMKSFKSAATTGSHQPIQKETILPTGDMKLDLKALDSPFQESAAQSYTAEDIIDEVKSKCYVDEPYSMEEFTASAAFGVQISLDYSMERSKSLNSTFSSSSIPDQQQPRVSESRLSDNSRKGTSGSNINTSSNELLSSNSSSSSPRNKSHSKLLNSTTSSLPEVQWATNKPTKPRVAVDSAADALKREMPKFEKEIKKHMFPEVYKNGEYIIKKHEIGKEMYFIVKGKVEVVSGDGSTVYSTIHRGSFFGELGVLFNVPRTASIRAVEDCVCMVLTRESLEDILQYYPTIAAKFRTVAEQRMKEVNRKRSYRRKMEVKSKMDVVAVIGLSIKDQNNPEINPRNMTAVAPAPENHLLSGQVHLQLLPHTENPDLKPTLKELIDRKLKEGTPIRIGRQVIKDGQVQGRAANPILSASDIWFTSKVVSRNHAEMWVKDGQLYIKDIGSSSGTFLNKMRLSPSGKESRPYPIKEGDTLQFGIDYKGKQEDIYKSIIVKIGFYDNSWMRQQKKNSNPVRFKQALKALLAATNPYANTKDETVVDDGGSTDCCICIGAIGPYQALFIAPCSHCYHYKCVAGLLSVSQMFQCPLCRQVANLAASVSMESLYDSQDDVDKTEDEAGSKNDDDKMSDTGSDHSYDENRERKVYPKEKAPVHEISFPFVTRSASEHQTTSEQPQNVRLALVQSNESISSSGNGGGEQNRSRNSSAEPHNKWGRRKSGNSSPDPSQSPGKDKPRSSITNKITNIFGKKSYYGEPSLSPNNGRDNQSGSSPRQTKREVTNNSTRAGEDSLRRSRSAEILNQ